MNQGSRRSVAASFLSFLLGLWAVAPAFAQDEMSTTRPSAVTASISAQTTSAAITQSQVVGIAQGAALDAAKSHAHQPVAKPVVSENILPNGLKVVVLEDHSYPVVSCMTWYRVGSRYETPGMTGINHLLEHLLFGSVGTFKRGEIGSAIARVGGQFNGYTSDDFTTFFETLPTNRLEMGLKIESQRMRGGVFTDADVAEEVANIQSEFENAAKDGSSTLAREVRSSLYQRHPYHNPTMGWRTDVESLSAAQVKAYYDRYFQPNNCMLVVSGDVNTSTAMQSVAKYFGPIAAAPNAVSPPKVVEPAQHGERRITVKYPGKQEVLEVAYHGPAFDDADAPVMDVLEKMLNVAYAGRLKTKLLDSKVCTAASATFEAKRDPGFFTISCTAPASMANAQQRILDSLDSVINQLHSQPISDAELRRAKNQAEFAFYNEKEGPYRAGFHIGYFEALSQWQSSNTWVERVRSVSAADVQRVANKYLNSDNRVIAWLAGANASKFGPKPSSDTTSPPSKNSSPKRFDQRKLTGYKDDDNAIAPRNDISSMIAQAGATELQIAAEPQAPDAADGDLLDDARSDKPEKKKAAATPLDNAIKDIPAALPTAVKDIPAAIVGAPNALKELPAAVKGVPSVIKNIPSAIQGLPNAIEQIPSAIGSIPSAVKEVPNAIGGLPGAAKSAVMEIPGALGSIPSTAVKTIKEVPGAIVGIPGAAVSAVKGMPGALGTAAVEIGGIPGAISKQLAGKQEQPLQVVQRTLKNGMKLVIFESHLSPIVQIEGAVKAGSVYEPTGKSGIASLSAALLNEGTVKRGHNQLATLQEDLGLPPYAMLRFERGVETISFKSRALSKDVDTQLGLVAETLVTPAVADADVDRTKQSLIADIKQGDDSAEQKAARAMLRSLLASASAFAPSDPMETVKALNSISASDVRKYLANFVVPSATTLVVAGDVDPDKLTQSVERIFGNWEGKGLHQKFSAHPNPKRVLKASIPARDRTRATVSFGQLLPMAKQGPEFGSLLIADGILNGHPLVSRVNKRIANTPAVLNALGDNSVETKLEPLANSVEWTLTATVEPNAVPLTVQSIETELKQIAKDGVSSQEFNEVKRYLLGAIPVRSMSTVGGAAHALLETSVHGDETDGAWSTIASIKGASLDSVNRVIRTALKPDQTTLVLVGAPQIIRSVRPRVASSQPTPPSDTVSSSNSEPAANNDSSADLNSTK